MTEACTVKGGKNNIDLNLQETRSNLKNIPKLWEPFLDLLASKYVPIKLVKSCCFKHIGKYREIVLIKDEKLNIHTARGYAIIFFIKKNLYLRWWKDFKSELRQNKNGNYMY